MNSSSRPPGAFARLTARHSIAAAVVAVGATFTVVAIGVAWWTEDLPLPGAAWDLEMKGHPRLAPARVRCDTCGVIERIRPIEAVGAAPKSYEFAVRLPDGSLRFSSAAQAGEWQVGDRMQLLGGERTWSASP